MAPCLAAEADTARRNRFFDRDREPRPDWYTSTCFWRTACPARAAAADAGILGHHSLTPRCGRAAEFAELSVPRTR